MPEAGLGMVRSESRWAQLADVLGERMGLHYPEERRSDLERGIAAAAHAFGKSADACVDWLLSGPWSRQQIEILANCLTVGETYFFREKRSFEVLRDEILPGLLRARQAERRLRIWSAGCCTGEEPYSIAMLLAGTIPDIQRWNITILATDIDPEFLRKASAGIYSQWSFRDASADIQHRYFREIRTGRFEIVPRIRDLVTFAYLNLAEENYPSVANATNAMDIVFCRNVLMYFELAHARRVLQRLGWTLMEGGWLFINPVEIPHAPLPQLEPVQFDDVIVHRKTSAPHSAAPRPSPPASRSRHELASDVTPAATIVAATPAIPAPVSERELAIGLAVAYQPAREVPVRILHAKATAAYAQGDYAQTVQITLDILSGAPDDTTAIVLLAKAYANQGRLVQAQQCCEKAVASNKLNPEWRYLMATILQELGELDEAGDELRCALYLEPDSPLLHFSLGNLLRRQGRSADALRHFGNALALLESCDRERIVPHSEGLSAGRLADILRATLAQGSEP